MKDWSAVRAEWDRELPVTASRARLAVIALGASAALHIAKLAGGVWRPSVMNAFANIQVLLLFATAVVFLRWLHRMVCVSAIMSPKRLRWTPSAAVWSFFIPIISLWRPYQVVRDVHDQLAPEGVPEPAPKPLLDGSGGYRNVVMAKPPPAQALPHASIGLWWAFFLVGGTRVEWNGVAMENPLLDLLAFAGAMLAVFVVRAIESRLRERFRRVSNASDAELDAWEIRA